MKKFMYGKWTEWNDSLQNERKSLPDIPLIRDSYLQYIKTNRTLIKQKKIQSVNGQVKITWKNDQHPSHQRNANQNYGKMLSYHSQDGYHLRKQKTINVVSM